MDYYNIISPAQLSKTIHNQRNFNLILVLIVFLQLIICILQL